MRTHRTAAGMVAVLLSVGAPELAAAQTAPPRSAGNAIGDPPPLEWRYPEFATGEYVATGIFGGLAVGGLLIPVDPPRWTGRNGLDTGVRDAMRLASRDDRKTADDVSDLTLALSINYMLFDSLVVAWWVRDKGSVAYQMTAVDVETIAFTNAVTSIVKGVAARERPYGPECDRDPRYARTDDCDADARNRGFFSGHTSTTFAAASVSCMHHVHLGLYGGRGADAAACAAAYGMAATTGVLRVMSDNHSFSDVAVGAAFGTLAGLGLPWLLHYGRPTSAPEPAARDAVRVRLVPGPTSATLLGVF